jgi:hypothetical protein
MLDPLDDGARWTVLRRHHRDQRRALISAPPFGQRDGDLTRLTAPATQWPSTIPQGLSQYWSHRSVQTGLQPSHVGVASSECDVVLGYST